MHVRKFASSTGGELLCENRGDPARTAGRAMTYSCGFIPSRKESACARSVWVSYVPRHKIYLVVL
jgi:hypothetical protein